MTIKGNVASWKLTIESGVRVKPRLSTIVCAE